MDIDHEHEHDTEKMEEWNTAKDLLPTISLGVVLKVQCSDEARSESDLTMN